MLFPSNSGPRRAEHTQRVPTQPTCTLGECLSTNSSPSRACRRAKESPISASACGGTEEGKGEGCGAHGQLQ